jgi:UDP-glucose 4-epimerase
VRNGTIVIHGEGDQTRDYIYLDDVVRAMIAASTAPNVNHQIINIGSGRETSVRELARLVLKITNSDAEILYNPRNDPGVSRMCADISLAKEKLTFQPRVSLEEGLRLTLEKDPLFRKELVRVRS